jgi:hypothetical protein
MNESACIACCLICTLSERMKDCINCPFNAGLTVKAAQVEQAKQNTVFIQEELKP